MVNAGSEPAGFWQSDLTAQAATQGQVEYGQLQVSDAGVPYWVEYRPAEQGRNLLCRFYQKQVQTLTPTGFSIRSRVHEYGGVCWCLLDQQLVFVNGDDQQLYLQDLTSLLIQPLTQTPDARYLQPIHDAKRQRLIAVQELHACADKGADKTPTEPINRLVSICLQTGNVSPLHQGYDFYSSPVLNPAADKLAFIGWNHPAQPWLATQLCLAELSQAGQLQALTILAGQDQPQALCQPDFVLASSGTSELWAVTDRGGNWQLHRFTPTVGENAVVEGQPGDCANAAWQAGERHWQRTESNHVLLACIERGHAQLLCWSDVQSQPLSQTAVPQRFTSEYSLFSHLRSHGNKLYCIAYSVDRLPAVIALDLTTGKAECLTGGLRSMLPEDCSLPRHFSYPVAESQHAHGFYYPPCNHAYAEMNEPPPLVVFLHGGPSAATYAMLNLRVQYWTQRGFAVVDLNYRGSTGYGRDYRLSLQHSWGQRDVEDAQTAVRYLIQQRLAKPDGCFIRGQSAGGYTALASLVDSDDFTAAASLYGVTDPQTLAEHTHKFESHYLDWLIGDPVAEAVRYRQRAPLQQVARIKTPVIFFQGMQDKVVVPAQTTQMYQQLLSQSVPAELHCFDDEGHGFRRAETQQWVLAQELRFYQQYLTSKSAPEDAH